MEPLTALSRPSIDDCIALVSVGKSFLASLTSDATSLVSDAKKDFPTET